MRSSAPDARQRALPAGRSGAGKGVMRKSAKPGVGGRAKGNFLLGVFVGLAVGLGIALGVAFYINKTPIPFLSKPKPAAKEADSAKAAPAISGLPTQPAV